MFTGLVQESARVIAKKEMPGPMLRLVIASTLSDAAQWSLGASIALNGACMTVVANEAHADGGRALSFDVSPESLARTQLGALNVGDRVHVESSLRMGQELGGHLVSGHVDGAATLESRAPQVDCLDLEFAVHGETRGKVAPYLVEKGSIALDGVSLTVNAVRDTADKTYFRVMLVPHTLQVTTLGAAQPGQRFNVEADMLAKYAARAQRWGAESLQWRADAARGI